MTALIRGCALAVMGETFGHLPLFPSQTSQGGHESVSRNSSIVLQFCLSTQDFAVSSHMLQPGFALCPRGLLQEQNLQYHIFVKGWAENKDQVQDTSTPWGCEHLGMLHQMNNFTGTGALTVLSVHGTLGWRRKLSFFKPSRKKHTDFFRFK